ncbi:unnamed protein product [Coregonus sp. 'balchen']|nr:unnamed protein product [Coregonus sp. 'balchen']
MLKAENTQVVKLLEKIKEMMERNMTVLLGKTKALKNVAGNIILAREAFGATGGRTAHCEKKLGEKQRRAVVEHMELLGENIWRHTLVLFTTENPLEDIKQWALSMEREGKALKSLLKQCEQRHHHRASEEGGEDGDRKQYYSMSQDSRFYKTLKRAAIDRGKRRMLKVQEQRNMIKENGKNIAVDPHDYCGL